MPPKIISLCLSNITIIFKFLNPNSHMNQQSNSKKFQEIPRNFKKFILYCKKGTDPLHNETKQVQQNSSTPSNTEVSTAHAQAGDEKVGGATVPHSTPPRLLPFKLQHQLSLCYSTHLEIYPRRHHLSQNKNGDRSKSELLQKPFFGDIIADIAKRSPMGVFGSSVKLARDDSTTAILFLSAVQERNYDNGRFRQRRGGEDSCRPCLAIHGQEKPRPYNYWRPSNFQCFPQAAKRGGPSRGRFHGIDSPARTHHLLAASPNEIIEKIKALRRRVAAVASVLLPPPFLQ